jgi:hypothetical protein
MSELQTTKDLTDAIIAERGGEQAFSAVQRRVAMALSAALANPKDVDPAAIAKLVDQLPPIVSGTGRFDVDDLSDAELTFLKALYDRHPKLAPPLDKDSFEAKLLAAQTETEYWRSECESLTARLGYRENSEVAAHRVAEAERAAFSAGYEAGKAAAVPMVGTDDRVVHAPVEPENGLSENPILPSNVRPIRPSGLEVTTSLSQRYPFGAS